jgi:hypothetical protein
MHIAPTAATTTAFLRPCRRLWCCAQCWTSWPWSAC